MLVLDISTLEFLMVLPADVALEIVMVVLGGVMLMVPFAWVMGENWGWYWKLALLKVMFMRKFLVLLGERLIWVVVLVMLAFLRFWLRYEMMVCVSLFGIFSRWNRLRISCMEMFSRVKLMDVVSLFLIASDVRDLLLIKNGVDEMVVVMISFWMFDEPVMVEVPRLMFCLMNLFLGRMISLILILKLKMRVSLGLNMMKPVAEVKLIKLSLFSVYLCRILDGMCENEILNEFELRCMDVW
jgi:hypothetical protein